jgi:acetyltransferase
LKNLLAPRSVALVGASPRHGSFGRAILNNIRKAQFKGEFGLVNPRYPEIDGVAAAGSIGKLAFTPELVVIATPAPSIAGLIDEAGRRGAAGAVIISAGLGHSGLARRGAGAKYGMRLIGPTASASDARRSLNASFQRTCRLRQSGADLPNRPSPRGWSIGRRSAVGFRHRFAWRQLDVDIDLLDYCAGRRRAILHIEAIKDARSCWRRALPPELYRSSSSNRAAWRKAFGLLRPIPEHWRMRTPSTMPHSSARHFAGI